MTTGRKNNRASNFRQKLGKWGENIALEFLTNRRYLLVCRNFRTPDGEIDLIMQKDGMCIMVEVKSRKDTEYSLPEEAVTEEKMEHIIDSAAWFFQVNPQFEENWRIDVIAIIGQPGRGKPQIEWFENVS